MRRPVSVAVAALLLTAAPAARGGDAGRATTPKTDTADAGLLADLDLLDSADYRRDREVARRQGLLERLRLLEVERTRARSVDFLEDASPAQAARPPGGTGSPAREKK